MITKEEVISLQHGAKYVEVSKELQELKNPTLGVI